MAKRRSILPLVSVTPLLLRVPDAASLLGMSEREVWAMLASGDLPKVTVPGRRMTRIAHADLAALVERWRQQSHESSETV